MKSVRMMGVLGVLVLCAAGAAGQSVCIFRPETIEQLEREPEPVLVQSRIGGTLWPTRIDARQALTWLKGDTSPGATRERASLAIQFTMARRGDWLPLGFRLQAWLDYPGVPPSTLGQMLQEWLWSGNARQRDEAGNWLATVVASPENVGCNGR